MQQLTPQEHDLVQSFFPQGLVVFDLETTGLSPLSDSVCEIGAFKVTDKVSQYHKLTKPLRPIPPQVEKIHGISNEMVKGEPTFDEVFLDFMTFTQELPLFAHNIPFDMGFLVAAFQRQSLTPSQNHLYCTCRLARQVVKEANNYRLSTLAQFFNEPLENHHRATDDAWVCLKVLLHILKSSPPEVKIKKSYVGELSQFKSDPGELKDRFPQLELAIQLKQKIEILYDGGSQRGSFRPIQPVGLMPSFKQGAVLHALCLLSDKYKNFSLSKIKEIRP